MWKNILIFLILTITLLGVGFFIYQSQNDSTETSSEAVKIISPFSKLAGEKMDKNNQAPQLQDENKSQEPLIPDFKDNNPLNIMLLGLDRRSRDEPSRTDIMILLSIDKKTNRVVLASIPRDLWWLDGRLNSVYTNKGWEEMQKAVLEITGQKPDRYIVTDFKDFSWIVDAMGGVKVNVENSFVDESFPVDETKEYQTVQFNSGEEKLSGERALIFARSRKGNNGEGSDWSRMKRQHKILKGMLEAVQQPESIFKPMVVENAFRTVTEGKMDTNLNISDARYLWDFYKDKDKYVISSLYLDENYLYTPPMEDYGGAWVLAQKDNGYKAFSDEIKANLNPKLKAEKDIQETQTTN